jgi:hypothetical protein
MGVVARFSRYVFRMLAVLGLAAAGMMAYLGKPLLRYRCPAYEGCTALPPGFHNAYGQPSLLHRFGLLIQGYWPGALLALAIVAGTMAVLGGVRPGRNRQPRSEDLGRTFC